MFRSMREMIHLRSSCNKVTNLRPGGPYTFVRRDNSTLIQRFRGVAPHHYFMLVFPCISFYLGVWQIRRRKWKVDLIDELERKCRMPGVAVPQDLSEISPDREFETFILEGEFDYSRETFIGPRVLLDTGASAGGLISSGKTIGVHVVTPLKLSGRDEEILVNRGWISRKSSRENTYARPTGVQKIEAVYRNTESGSADGGFDRRTKMWARRNVSTLASSLGTSEIFFDMSESRTNQLSANSPVPGQTNVHLRNEHMSYIFTWFSLTILMLMIWSNRHLRDVSKHSKLLNMVKSIRRDQIIEKAKKR